MASLNPMHLHPLPKDKTAVSVFADFLRYLYNCTKNYIQDTHANGHDLWVSVEHHVEFVLTHPNGWEGAQQSQMRRAAVLGGLIPDSTDGQARLQFVTEGGASLHFCIGNGYTADAMKVRCDNKSAALTDNCCPGWEWRNHCRRWRGYDRPQRLRYDTFYRGQFF